MNTQELPVVHVTSLDFKFRDSIFAMFYAKQAILDKYGEVHERKHPGPGQFIYVWVYF